VTRGRRRRSPGRLRRLARLPGDRRRLLVEAGVTLAAARVAVSLLPFRVVARALGREDAIPGAAPDSAVEPAGAAGSTAERVGWAVTTAARQVPWPATCLVQALAAALMLAARRVPALTVLGVDRDGRALRAHAWLRCGTTVVVGAPVHTTFTPVAAFVRPARRAP
jgi:hypothetical protein